MTKTFKISSAEIQEAQRKPLDSNTIKNGDIVAFKWVYDDNKAPQIGVACMANKHEFYAAYNLYGAGDTDDDGVWIEGKLPSEIVLYHPTIKEFELALDKFWNYCMDKINYEDPSIFPLETSFRKTIDELSNTINQQNDTKNAIIRSLIAKIKEKEEEKNEILLILIKAREEIDELKTTINELKKHPSEDDFVKRFVKETKHFHKHDRKKADVIRQIMIKVGRADADEELDAWIEGSERPLVKIENAGDVIADGGKKIVKNVNEA